MLQKIGPLTESLQTTGAAAVLSGNAAFAAEQSTVGYALLRVTGSVVSETTSITWLAQAAWKRNARGGYELQLLNLGGAPLQAFGMFEDTNELAGAALSLINNNGALTPQVAGVDGKTITWDVSAEYFVAVP
jgi:hypothetical protein